MNSNPNRESDKTRFRRELWSKVWPIAVAISLLICLPFVVTKGLFYLRSQRLRRSQLTALRIDVITFIFVRCAEKGYEFEHVGTRATDFSDYARVETTFRAKGKNNKVVTKTVVVEVKHNATLSLSDIDFELE